MVFDTGPTGCVCTYCSYVANGYCSYVHTYIRTYVNEIIPGDV